VSHVAETAGDTVYPEHVAEGKMSQLLANLGRFASRQESHTRNPACKDLLCFSQLKKFDKKVLLLKCQWR
jgi:hypothetical protein